LGGFLLIDVFIVISFQQIKIRFNPFNLRHPLSILPFFAEAF
jgi:hypothetical protein